jgi:hypothetical protein
VGVWGCGRKNSELEIQNSESGRRLTRMNGDCIVRDVKGPKRITRAKSEAVPAGLKVSRRNISPALKKMLMEDRGVASGGRNIVHRRRSV